MWAYLYRVAKKVLQREEEKKDLQELVYMVFSILHFSVFVCVCSRVSLRMCLCNTCTQCPQRLEESVGASGTGARVISCHVGPLEEQPVFLAAKAALRYGLCVNKDKQV